MSRKPKAAKVEACCFLTEVERRIRAGRRVGLGASYLAALTDLVGWLESDGHKPHDPDAARVLKAAEKLVAATRGTLGFLDVPDKIDALVAAVERRQKRGVK